MEIGAVFPRQQEPQFSRGNHHGAIVARRIVGEVIVILAVFQAEFTADG
jgi:hypothetical protein